MNAMVDKLRTFFRTTIIGGLVVLLPLVLLLKIGHWLYSFLREQLRPLAVLLQESIGLPDSYAGGIAFVLVISVCFWVGVVARIRFGASFWRRIESLTLERIPGYRLLKDMVGTFSGGGNAAFNRAVLVRPWGAEVYFTGFITDTADNGYVSVFVPTSPTPTTGLVFMVPAERVVEINDLTGHAFKTVLACGAGNAVMMQRIATAAGEIRG